MGKKFTAQTIEQVRYMSYPAAHPDGHEAVYVCSMHRKIGRASCRERVSCDV